MMTPGNPILLMSKGLGQDEAFCFLVRKHKSWGTVAHGYFFAPANIWLISGPFLKGLFLVGQEDETFGKGNEHSPSGWEGEVRRVSEGNKAYRRGRQRCQTSKNFSFGHIANSVLKVKGGYDNILESGVLN